MASCSDTVKHRQFEHCFFLNTHSVFLSLSIITYVWVSKRNVSFFDSKTNDGTHFGGGYIFLSLPPYNLNIRQFEIHFKHIAPRTLN